MLTGGYFKATKPNVVNPHAVSVNGNKSRTVSRDMAIQPGSIENHSARTDNHEAPQPPQSTIDPSAYVDATATSQLQVELETPVQQTPAVLQASPDGHLTAVSASFDANCLNYNPASYGGEIPLTLQISETYQLTIFRISENLLHWHLYFHASHPTPLSHWHLCFHIFRLSYSGISTITSLISFLYATTTSVANSMRQVDVSSCISAGVVLLFVVRGKGGRRGFVMMAMDTGRASQRWTVTGEGGEGRKGSKTDMEA
ncbi:hypothetical protein Trisim1_006044 [Trichoderma cf. simile WF8]